MMDLCDISKQTTSICGVSSFSKKNFKNCQFISCFLINQPCDDKFRVGNRQANSFLFPISSFSSVIQDL